MRLFETLETRLDLKTSMTAYIAGGMATHLYTAQRVTTDVDAEFSKRVLIPHDLMVEIELENGMPQLVYLDTNYNSSFALMHEDYLHDSIEVPMDLAHIQVRVLAPVDLAVSKISRFSDTDKDDIRALVEHELTTWQAIEARARQAVGGYIGDTRMLEYNIRDAVALARQFQPTA